MAEHSDTQTGQKRRRSDQDFIRDTDLWMEDGNIVIAATDNSAASKEKATYALKCHRSVLSRQSHVFEGLLGIPPSAETQDMYDGLPLVVLPDAYVDVKGALRYLYEPGEIPLAGTHLWDIDVACEVLKQVQGPVRFAAKYEFTKLHARLAETLESMWPTTLEDWDARRIWLENRNMHWKGQSPWAAQAVRLGDEARIPSIIPAALFAISIELPHVSGTCYRLDNYNGTEVCPEDAVLEFSLSLLGDLLPAHFAQLVAGCEILKVITERLVNDVLPDTTQCYRHCIKLDSSSTVNDNLDLVDIRDNCRTPCARDIDRWWKFSAKKYITDYLRQMAYVDPLRTLSRLDGFFVERPDPAFGDLDVCDMCLYGTRNAMKYMREYIWEELPYFFSVKRREPDAVHGYKQYLDGDFAYVPC